MIMAKDLRQKIKEAIQQFGAGNLSENALNLFQTLGYITERRAPLEKPAYIAFRDSFIDSQSRFNEDKALVKEWKYVDLLFQLSKEEVTRQLSLFDTKQVDRTVIETYLFFAIEMAEEHYTRTDLSHITREVNRLFPMPVMILFKHGFSLTLSAINRRLHKRDKSKDVLEKVTLIKDIRISPAGGGDVEIPLKKGGKGVVSGNGAVTHRAHIEILFDLSFDELKNKHKFTNFVELHNAWQKALDTSELNKRFFRELANWYFWATQKVVFPDDAGKDKDVRNATSVIRLITRLMFVWFLKEKGLVPDALFDEKQLKKLLKYTDNKKSAYYKAILQNLFFATLNTEMGKRGFRTKNDSGRDGHYFIHNVFRYENEFVKPKETLEQYFSPIPFLNGGLFECLDKELDDDGKRKRIRIDSFSDREDNVLEVPDELFFNEKGVDVDLSRIYSSSKKNKEKVYGIIDILNSYKFTVAENTPIEEEIALDPELLGKVFENLLANYNPETQTTARKQTGSFYTPREIVNYMVDESLLAYLKQSLSSCHDVPSRSSVSAGHSVPFCHSERSEESNNTDKNEERLRDLLSYSENPNPFNTEEAGVLVKAIDTCKILDPACGSGAFPMGILHRMVHILHKLDPNNARWKQRQLDKVDKLIEDAEGISDTRVREKVIEDLHNTRRDIEEAFDNNEFDYGRKLYLIENCIYGIDIQSIAVQIAKLRFFISLIVDQKVNHRRDNLGVRPLPNLETKFVAANTLIGLEKEKAHLFTNPDIEKKKAELKKVRHDYFEARTPRRKETCRIKDKQLRDELAELLIENHDFQPATAKKIAAWDPYDQNNSATFFDTEWMFGIKEGFDVVIGNPPYIRAEDLGDLKTYLKATYTVFAPSGDIFYYFYERSFNILTNQGVFCFINNAFDKTTAGKTLRKYVSDNFSLNKYVDFKSVGVFEGTTTYPIILLAIKSKHQEAFAYLKVTEDLFGNFNSGRAISYTLLPSSALKQFSWSFDHQGQVELSEKISIHKKLKDVFGKCYYGIKTALNEAFITEKDLRNSKHLKPVFEGKDIKKWQTPAIDKKMIVFENKSTRTYFNGQDEAKAFEAMRAAFPSIMNHLKPFAEAARKRYDKGEFWWELRNCAYYDLFAKPKIIFPNLQNSNKFAYDISGTYLNAPAVFLPTDAKWLLGILNSKVVWYFLKTICVVRSGGFIEVKPQYFEQIPIPILKNTDKKQLDSLVDQILTEKQKDPNADTSPLERQIDQLVYKLYGLTGVEITIIEGGK
ncbi:MAG: type II restriction endonuclease [Candidatus Kuenenia stuttgartiensis]|nr:MAG: type II restriction endonuclease [Candidatus Kuenenia stuttgartiensis]